MNLTWFLEHLLGIDLSIRKTVEVKQYVKPLVQETTMEEVLVKTTAMVVYDPSSVPVKVEEKLPLTEFQKIREKFNPIFDLIVISETLLGKLKLTSEDYAWLDTLGDKAIYLDKDHLINVGIVRAQHYGGF